jgi:hypothetical protein
MMAVFTCEGSEGGKYKGLGTGGEKRRGEN